MIASAAAPGADVVDTADEVAAQQALDEQQPRGDADQRRGLAANEGAETHADRRPERGRRHAPRDQDRALERIEAPPGSPPPLLRVVRHGERINWELEEAPAAQAPALSVKRDVPATAVLSSQLQA